MKALSKKFALVGTIVSASFLLAGCPSESDTTPAGKEPVTGGASAADASMKFSPFTGEFPLPINLLFDLSPTTTDFTLNIPSTSPPAVAGNQLDGWSTIAPFTAQATEALDPATVSAPGAVRVFRVCGDPFRFGAPTGTPLGELTPGVDFSVSVANADDSTIVVKPLKPLADKYDDISVATCPAGAQGNLNKGNTYIVVVTNTVKATDGGDVGTSSVYELSTNPLCFYKFEGDSDSDCPGSDASTPVGLTAAGEEAGIGTASDASQQSSENVRRLVNGQEALAIGISAFAASMGSPLPALDGDSIVLSYSFSPVAIDNPDALTVTTAMGNVKFPDTWDWVKGAATQAGAGQTLTLFETGQTVPGGTGRVLVGSLTVPYYLTVPSAGNPTAPLTESWKADSASSLNQNSDNLTFHNSQPLVTQQIDIPVLAVLPQAASSMDNLPVAILQHGITTNRVAVAAIAEALSRAGIASVSIDLPLHGITTDSDFAFLRSDSDGLAPLSLPGERTFDVDYVNNESGAAGPDGNADASGTHFINLANLVVSRDNLRQAVSDLLTLQAALANLEAVDPTNMEAGPTAGFDSSKQFFFGHSLGGIVGTTFLAQTGDIDAASLAKAGGGIAKLLDTSAGFGPRITAGLGAEGVSEGTSDFESFLYFAQAAVDVADPLNQASKVTAPIHAIQIEGGGNATSTGPAVVTISVPSDLVVPRDAFNPVANIEVTPEPGLGGTVPLNTALNLTEEKRNADTCNFRPANAPVVVQFDTGTHSTVALAEDTISGLNFDFSAEQTEMLNQIASFFGGVALGGPAVVPIDQTCAPAG